MSARLVEEALAEARRHRALDDVEAAERAVDEAWALASGLGPAHPLRQIAAWRRAKLRFDRGRAAGAIEALEPILDDPDPFEHYERGLEAVEPLARAWWDSEGYGAPAIRRLWQRYVDVWAARGDPYLAASGRCHLAWDLACAGDLARLEASLEEIATLDPGRFRRGPTRHPRASDAPTSIPWLQLEIARTALRGATWARDPRLATLAIELLEDAAEEVELRRDAEFWFLEPMALAALRLGAPEARRYVAPWSAAAPALRHERASLHAALARAELARRAGESIGAAQAFLEVADLAATRGWGFEWEIDALVEATRAAGATPDPEWARRARRLVAERGVGVFATAVGELG